MSPKTTRRALRWVSASVLVAVACFGVLVYWPDPLFAHSLTSGKITVASDSPIPKEAAERVLRDCERLLERSPLRATGNRYRLYVTNSRWRQRLFFIPRPYSWGLAYGYPFGDAAFMSGANFETGRVVHWGYVGTPPRTLSWLCAHELTHIIAAEHVGLNRFFVPEWVWEGLADYVGIEDRQSFDNLRDALGNRLVDIPMRVKFGSYPRYRLLVTYFLESKQWSIEQLLQTRLTYEQASESMRAEGK